MNSIVRVGDEGAEREERERERREEGEKTSDGVRKRRMRREGRRR